MVEGVRVRYGQGPGLPWLVVQASDPVQMSSDVPDGCVSQAVFVGEIDVVAGEAWHGLERVRVDRMGDPRRGQAMQNWRRCSSVWPGVRLIRRRTTWVWPEASPGRQSVTSPSRVGKDCPSMVTVSGRAAPRGRVMAAA